MTTIPKKTGASRRNATKKRDRERKRVGFVDETTFLKNFPDASTLAVVKIKEEESVFSVSLSTERRTEKGRKIERASTVWEMKCHGIGKV